MSKSSKSILAVVALVVLAACSPRAGEYVVAEPVPAPIYVEPASTKF